MTGFLAKDRVHKVLKACPHLRLAYLFGSRAEGTAEELSDYDFAVLIDHVPDVLALQSRLAHELASALTTNRVDVVVLNKVPIELAYAVIASGELLCQRDEATRVEFEAQVMGRYGDYLPVLRAQRRDVYRGGEYAARVRRYRAAFGRTERKIGEIRAAQAKGTE